MSRALVLSNGTLCVALDSFARVRDIYYPHVGQEDHVRGHYTHRIGVWIEGRLSWLGEDGEWQIAVSSAEDTLEGSTVARHPGLQVELSITDSVYNERPIFLRKMTVKNLSDRNREIKVYFAHQFEIYKAHGGDTAYYDPQCDAIIHYKGRRVFLISALLEGALFNDFATGLAGFLEHEGTHRDAEDGMLSKNPIEHGPADSVIGLYGSYDAGQSKTIVYWVAAAETIPDAHELNTYIKTKTPEHLIRTAGDFWRAWVGSYERHFVGLSKEAAALFSRSLLLVRTHVDAEGGILASVDSDMLQYGLDTYAYVWPRDGAYSAMALDAAGDTNAARRFFEFCREVIRAEGYFMHKYWPDKSLGSSWHPWVRDGHSAFPIQEDETALVVYALAHHYMHSRDIEFIESVFAPLIEKTAEFMILYRDTRTGLPLPSYDLWEEKWGTTTFTASAVYGALMAASEIARALGKQEHALRWEGVAQEMREGIMTHLWDEKSGTFIKMIERKGDEIIRDMTLDVSSAYGVFAFNVLPSDDPKLARMFGEVARRLSHGITAGGIARYEDDKYYRSNRDATGNPWVTTTLWYAEYLISLARTESDLERARSIFNWVVRHALPSGVLSEQIDPYTGAQMSAAPLTWSHAAYVHTVLKYLNKLEELGLCKDCNPVP